jgi:hypothetical protein
MKVHKFIRKLKEKAQYRMCDLKRCVNAENVSYFWGKVTCKECKKRKL